MVLPMRFLYCIRALNARTPRAHISKLSSCCKRFQSDIVNPIVFQYTEHRKGAFAKRDLPKNTIITGTPLLHFPSENWFDMYEYQTCEDGRMVRNVTNGPYGQQLLLNYCFGHPSTSLVLCPYGSGANYINHNKTRANVKVQWSKNGVTNHHAEWLDKNPDDFFADYSTKVALDYIAIRDISQGEELLLDYVSVCLCVCYKI